MFLITSQWEAKGPEQIKTPSSLTKRLNSSRLLETYEFTTYWDDASSQWISSDFTVSSWIMSVRFYMFRPDTCTACTVHDVFRSSAFHSLRAASVKVFTQWSQQSHTHLLWVLAVSDKSFWPGVGAFTSYSECFCIFYERWHDGNLQVRLGITKETSSQLLPSSGCSWLVLQCCIYLDVTSEAELSFSLENL